MTGGENIYFNSKNNHQKDIVQNSQDICDKVKQIQQLFGEVYCFFPFS